MISEMTLVLNNKSVNGGITSMYTIASVKFNNIDRSNIYLILLFYCDICSFY